MVRSRQSQISEKTLRSNYKSESDTKDKKKRENERDTVKINIKDQKVQ